VMAASAPRFQRHLAETYRVWFGFRARIEINVPIYGKVVIGPFTCQQSAGVEINYVGFKGEARVRFDSRALKLLVSPEGENVVPNGIGLAIMLVKPAVGGAIDDIALRQNAAAALVEIDPPAAVT